MSTSQNFITPMLSLVGVMDKFADHTKAVIAKVGMGVIYEQGSQKGYIRHFITIKQQQLCRSLNT